MSVKTDKTCHCRPAWSKIPHTHEINWINTLCHIFNVKYWHFAVMPQMSPLLSVKIRMLVVKSRSWKRTASQMKSSAIENEMLAFIVEAMSLVVFCQLHLPKNMDRYKRGAYHFFIQSYILVMIGGTNKSTFCVTALRFFICKMLTMSLIHKMRSNALRKQQWNFFRMNHSHWSWLVVKPLALWSCSIFSTKRVVLEYRWIDANVIFAEFCVIVSIKDFFYNLL